MDIGITKQNADLDGGMTTILTGAAAAIPFFGD